MAGIVDVSSVLSALQPPRGLLSIITINISIFQSEIDSIILVGGGTRVPKVQETLMEVTKR